jgi:hypothetical protein
VGGGSSREDDFEEGDEEKEGDWNQLQPFPLKE